MIIQSKHLKLQTVQENDIEQIRQWRNDPNIVRYMEYQEEISSAMQKSWFEKIRHSPDYYLTIFYKKERIGLIHLRYLSQEIAESGLFIGVDSYRSSPLSYWASLPLLDFGFNFLQLSKITAKVHLNNVLAKNYNQSLGFEFTQNVNENFQEFGINKDQFLKVVQENRAYTALTGSYRLIADSSQFNNSPTGLFISKSDQTFESQL